MKGIFFMLVFLNALAGIAGAQTSESNEVQIGPADSGFAQFARNGNWLFKRPIFFREGLAVTFTGLHPVIGFRYRTIWGT